MSAAAIPITDWEGESVEDWRARWRIPRLDAYAVIGSTNDAARSLAEEGAPAGTVVLADEQTSGRGRMGRRWIAPGGRALLLSIVLRPGPAGRRNALPGTAPLRVALAVARAIDRVAHIAAGIKWPNDVVVPGAGKLAGILCEAALAHGGTEYVVAGIGINTGQSAEDFPEDIAGTASSMLIASGRPADRGALAGEVIEGLRPFDLRGLQALEPDELDEIAARDILRGSPVHVDGAAAGTAAGIAPDGALLLSTAEGAVPVHFGTVRVRDSVRGRPHSPPGRGGRRDPTREGKG